jgi:cytochrome c556
MVSRKMLKMVTAGALVVGLGVTLAFASADDQIKARQAEMKANGKAMGAFVGIIKGETPYDAAVVKANIDAMLAAEAAAMAAKAWDADSQKGETVETFAKPEAWTDAKGFGEAYGALVKARDAVAASTDEASFKAAFPALGAACKDCHEKYRRPKG